MTEDDLAREFEQHRRRLHGVALRMLGSSADADDAVQEAWLRLHRSEGIDNLGGWLTTVVSRVCLDMLRAGGRRPASYDDPRQAVADVVPLRPGNGEAPAGQPEQEVELADAVGGAMLLVLQAMAPAERLAFVLHDVFGVPFEEVAEVLGRSPAAARQLASRGRRRVRDPEPEQEAARAQDDAVVDAFMEASRAGDFTRLLELLDPQAEVRADDAAVRLGSTALVAGARGVAETFAGRARAALPAVLDGIEAAAWVHRGEAKVAFGFVIENGLITTVELLGDPAVLAPHRLELQRPERRGDHRVR